MVQPDVLEALKASRDQAREEYEAFDKVVRLIEARGHALTSSPGPGRTNRRKCLVPGCQSAPRARGLCTVHYFRSYRQRKKLLSQTVR